MPHNPHSSRRIPQNFRDKIPSFVFSTTLYVQIRNTNATSTSPTCFTRPCPQEAPASLCSLPHTWLSSQNRQHRVADVIMGLPKGNKRTHTKTRRKTRCDMLTAPTLNQQLANCSACRDIDQIKADLLSPKHLKAYKDTKAPEDLPGLGRWYCVECAKWFETEFSLTVHRRGKPHKRRFVFYPRLRMATRLLPSRRRANPCLPSESSSCRKSLTRRTRLRRPSAFSPTMSAHVRKSLRNPSRKSRWQREALVVQLSLAIAHAAPSSTIAHRQIILAALDATFISHQ